MNYLVFHRGLGRIAAPQRPLFPANPMILNNQQKKRFRTIGHQLQPVVTVAGKGITENILTETTRALTDHELIKVKVAIGDREEKAAAITTILEVTDAALVQSIGSIILIYKPAAKPNPKLSNILRANLL